MRVVVSGASGLIGRPLVRHLRAQGHEVLTLVRRAPGGPGEVRWDPAAGDLDPAQLGGVDAAVNLSGAGVGDHRWTGPYKDLVLSSRVDSTRTLVRALLALDTPPRVLVNASAIGAYGDAGDAVLTEDAPRGTGFLAEVVARWEEETRPAAEAGVRVALARTGLVADPAGGAFEQLLTLFRLGLGGRLGTGRHWWSLITTPDEVAALAFLLESPLAGPVNLACPQPARNAEVTRALGRALHRPAVLAVPPPALRLVLGEFAGEVMASQRVVPRALVEAGFRFRHPDAASVTSWLAGATG
ncbi:TIGR01777 family oxidoreductase [Kineococcus auxinigenes]|uniref:TIGR01777 family oxidoreductase n=1 Tax=unclassified Kineococcus TaxID=2621656 RepID=UPI003D7EC702